MFIRLATGRVVLGGGSRLRGREFESQRRLGICVVQFLFDV